MNSLRRFVWMCLLVPVAGCGDADWGTVTGTTTLDGQPMSKGTVTLEPVAGGPAAYATIASNGSFRVMTGGREGLKVGDYKVTVVDQTIPESGTEDVVKLLTPARYAAFATSELTATIKPGPNTLEFHLKK